MPLDTTALNAAVLFQLGESGGVIFHVSDGASPPVVTDKPAQACFRGAWSGTSVLGDQVDVQDPQLLLPTEDILDSDGEIVKYPGWSSIGGAQGTTVDARGKAYTVVDVQPDDGGMTLLTVKVYTP